MPRLAKVERRGRLKPAAQVPRSCRRERQRSYAMSEEQCSRVAAETQGAVGESRDEGGTPCEVTRSSRSCPDGSSPLQVLPTQNQLIIGPTRCPRFTARVQQGPCAADGGGISDMTSRFFARAGPTYPVKVALIEALSAVPRAVDSLASTAARRGTRRQRLDEQSGTDCPSKENGSLSRTVERSKFQLARAMILPRGRGKVRTPAVDDVLVWLALRVPLRPVVQLRELGVTETVS